MYITNEERSKVKIRIATLVFRIEKDKGSDATKKQIVDSVERWEGNNYTSNNNKLSYLQAFRIKESSLIEAVKAKRATIKSVPIITTPNVVPRTVDLPLHKKIKSVFCNEIQTNLNKCLKIAKFVDSTLGGKFKELLEQSSKILKNVAEDNIEESTRKITTDLNEAQFQLEMKCKELLNWTIDEVIQHNDDVFSLLLRRVEINTMENFKCPIELKSIFN